jgi:hypothetical protein
MFGRKGRAGPRNFLGAPTTSPGASWERSSSRSIGRWIRASSRIREDEPLVFGAHEKSFFASHPPQPSNGAPEDPANLHFAFGYANDHGSDARIPSSLLSRPSLLPAKNLCLSRAASGAARLCSPADLAMEIPEELPREAGRVGAMVLPSAAIVFDAVAAARTISASLRGSRRCSAGESGSSGRPVLEVASDAPGPGSPLDSAA